jgi:hypothetical protein
VVVHLEVTATAQAANIKEFTFPSSITEINLFGLPN